GVGTPPSAEISNEVNPTCNSYKDGSFDVVVTEGYAAFTYSLNGGGFISSGVFSGLADGSYSVTVKDGNGCTTSVSVTLTEPAAVVVTATDPAAVCAPEVVDLTESSVTTGSDAGLSFSYYTDQAATEEVSNPDAINVSGTYYIVGITSSGCS